MKKYLERPNLGLNVEDVKKPRLWRFNQIRWRPRRGRPSPNLEEVLWFVFLWENKSRFQDSKNHDTGVEPLKLSTVLCSKSVRCLRHLRTHKVAKCQPTHEPSDKQHFSPHKCRMASAGHVLPLQPKLLLIGMLLEFAGNNNVTYSIIHGPVRWNQMLPLCHRGSCNLTQECKDRSSIKVKTWWNTHTTKKKEKDAQCEATILAAFMNFTTKCGPRGQWLRRRVQIWTEPRGPPVVHPLCGGTPPWHLWLWPEDDLFFVHATV